MKLLNTDSGVKEWSLESELTSFWRRFETLSASISQSIVGSPSSPWTCSSAPLTRQQELSRLYRRIVFLGGGLVVLLMMLLSYLLVRWSHYLFR